MHQKGLAPLLILVVVAILALVVYLLVNQATSKIPSTSKEPTVELQSQYQNPFDKNAQYVNPFSEYKNPFDNL